MARTLADQTLALAGVFQATHLVEQLAKRGIVDSFALEASINSIFIQEPDSTLEVYGDYDGIKTGLRQLRDHLTARNMKNLDTLKYAAALLKLERSLNSQKNLMADIGKGIDEAHRQVDHFSMLHSAVIGKLADIYSNTVSTMTPRIMVNGEQSHLSNPETVNKIRALLLAGIRSAVLWRQTGGSKWQLLFSRKKILNQIDQLIHIS